MKKLILLFLLLSGCGTLRDDASQPVLDAGFPSAEIYVTSPKGRTTLKNGLAMIGVRPGDSLADLNVSVQAYFQGRIQIDSNSCDLHITREYVDSERIRIPFHGIARENCFVRFVIAPRLPRQENGTVQVYPYFGVVAIRVLDAPPLDRFESEAKVTSSLDQAVDIKVADAASPVQVFATGCGVTKTVDLVLDSSGILSFSLRSMIENRKQTCVLTGIVIHPEIQDLYFDILVSQYDSEFLPLPVPVLTLENGRVCYSGSPEAAITAIDERHSFKKSGCLRFDPLRPNTLRQISVKGRTAMAQWTPEDKVWKWVR